MKNRFVRSTQLSPTEISTHTDEEKLEGRHVDVDERPTWLPLFLAFDSHLWTLTSILRAR